ncbi:DUF6518 family protein [Nocardioides mangrovi]|uniref:DUF6518 family protein n=1 Tax=Nocardioides mangrovi TaxID=2874580 RepID=A0ABS7UCX3_9ACTN|nr:DUF6518 family protein [Nocardioides mangrovi]MBZ5738826.1 DUF6518 family protein [Nocardioides mangrovi]
MTIATTAPPTPTPTQQRALLTLPIALVVAVGAGTALGVLDLAWNAERPSVWSAAANSCAVWAASAYAVGVLLAARLRIGPVAGALAGVLMLVVAVEAYYLAGIHWLGNDRSVLTSASTQTWLQLSVLVGSVLGAAGVWAVRGSWFAASLATAACAAMFFGDALQVWAYRPPGAWPGIEHVLVILGALVLVASVRRPAVAATAAVLFLPLSVVVALAFLTTGMAA